MSFRNKQPIAPMRHRSSSTIRSNPSSYTSSRPRSLGYFGSNTMSYSSPYSTPSSYYNANNYNGYSSTYQSPYFQNGYRSNAGKSSSGYASLTIPAKALSNINVITPNYSKSYDNNRDYVKSDSSGHRSRRDAGRRSSYRDRERSLSRSRNSLASSLGSRSISLTSLNSEGYVVLKLFRYYKWIYLLMIYFIVLYSRVELIEVAVNHV